MLARPFWNWRITKSSDSCLHIDVVVCSKPNQSFTIGSLDAFEPILVDVFWVCLEDNHSANVDFKVLELSELTWFHFFHLC